MTRTTLVTLLLALLTLSVGCDDAQEAETRLRLTLFHEGDLGLPTGGVSVAALRVLVVDRQGEVLSTELVKTSEGSGGVVPELPYGEEVQLQLEAVGAIGQVAASGATPFFEVSEESGGLQEYFVYLSEVGKISPLKSIFAGPQVGDVSLGDPRSGHTMTPLPDGRWLVIGGAELVSAGSGIGGSTVSKLHSSVLVFNPARYYFDPASTPDNGELHLTRPRAYHETVVLPDGRIMVIGGLTESGDGTYLQASESVNIIEMQEDGRFSIRELSLNVPRYRHAAVVRGNGSVLVMGGESIDFNLQTTTLDSVEVLPANTEVFEEVTALLTPRADFTAAAFAELVMVAGGRNGEQVLSSTEILSGEGFNLVPQELGDLQTARYGHSSLVHSTDNGRYWVVAGGFTQHRATPTASLEVFDTSLGRWVSALSAVEFSQPRAYFDLLELSDGALYAAGGIGLEGSDQASISDVEVIPFSTAGGFSLGEPQPIPGGLSQGRFDATSIFLENGNVLTVGGGIHGANGGYSTSPTADIFNPGLPI